jgi:S-adenosylmethionine:tRNA ribosyltransferase-isomerase
MKQAKDIHIEDFNYDLPENRIAKFPLKERDSSKLLVWKNQQITENSFQNLGDYIPDDALLVFNNTRVIQARLIFEKATGAQIEIFCLEPKEPADYVRSFVQTQSCTWLCLIGNAKKWKDGKLLKEVHGAQCSVEKIESYGETHLVRFAWNNPNLSFADILEKYGELPIPPYLNRKTEESDKETYQTIYSRIKGSVAAPTAGLHFTESVFHSLKQKHIDFEELTLHVGAGTFKPVKSETLADHVMHTECISVKKSTIEKLLEKTGRIFAVGTTSVRTLESLYYIGVALETHPNADPEALAVSQWTPYAMDNEQFTMNNEQLTMNNGSSLSVSHSLKNILDYMERKRLDVLTTHTQILIAPGYSFKIVDGMITNFHQPKSTLLLLISAFVGGNWHEIYNYALANDFRFLSYGDSSLLIKSNSVSPANTL